MDKGNSTYTQMPNNRKQNNRKKWAFLVVFVLIGVVAAYFATFQQQNIRDAIDRARPGKQQDKSTQNIVDPETGDLTEEALNNASNITIEDVRETSKSSGRNPLDSPALSDTEKSKQIREQIGNREQENHLVTFNENGLSIDSIEVRQGDLVTWINNSGEVMNIEGADGWGNRIPKDPGDRYSYGFLFLGEYRYTINGETEGIVTVVE